MEIEEQGLKDSDLAHLSAKSRTPEDAAKWC